MNFSISSSNLAIDDSEESLVVDLHLHSSASDGADPPRRVMQRAQNAGLRIVSLTDHDTVGGLDEGRREAERLGLEFVDGIELSSVHEGRLVHILGHFFWPADPALAGQVRRYTESRAVRMDEMISRLAGLGVEIDRDAFFREYGGASSLGRGQLSAFMVARGLVSRREGVFEKYLGEEGPAYVALDMISPGEAVRLIAGAGGAATFAHPNLSGADDIIEGLAAAGLAGIETAHASQNAFVRDHYAALAERYDLVQAGGSDCHGARPGPERMGELRLSVASYLALRRRAAGEK